MKSVRCHLARVLVPLCLFFLAHGTHAQEAGNTKTPAYETWDDDRLLSYTRTLLKEGRFYTRAIKASQETLKRNPKSLQAQLMLGAACASRFAALSYALSQVDDFRFRQKRYEEKVQAWEKAQQEADPTAPPLRVPALPPPLVTPDDGVPFTLSQEQARQQMSELARDTVVAFETARSLSEKASPSDKIECEMARGWGLFLLRRDTNRIIEDGPVSKNLEATAKNSSQKPPGVVYISPRDVIDSFEKCVELDSENSQAYHSLALALVPNRVLVRGWDESPASADDTRAVQMMDKAVALNSKDFDLLYQAGVITTKVDTVRAIDYLNRALKRQGTNALVWYVLADRLFQMAGKPSNNAETLAQQGKDAMKSGNEAPLFQSVAFTLPVPALLKRPWQYVPVYGQEADAVVAQLLLGHLEKRVKTVKPDDETEIITDATLLMNLGLRLVGSVSQDVVGFTDVSAMRNATGRMTIGTAVCLTAYTFLKKYLPAKPSPAYEDLREQYLSLAKQADSYCNDFLSNVE